MRRSWASILFELTILFSPLLYAGCASAPEGDTNRIESQDKVASAWQGDLVVQTRDGLIKGREDRGGSWVWRGIPYAAPPVGDLRWRAPEPAKPWTGIRDAGAFGGWSVQRSPFLDFIMGSEDCLYLNVWRPRGFAGDLPVYVYIHGGGNTAGASNLIDDYLGWAVASKSGMVFVSLNYRLGPLGWFLDPAIAAGADPDSASGNFGTLDIIEALRWVKMNISAFGGDPSRVTVAGESAGGLDTLSLLLSPRATGLFERAVVESGYDGFTSMADARTESGDLFAALLVKLGRAKTLTEAERIAASMPPAARAKLLRAASAKELLRLIPSSGLGMSKWSSTFMDGHVIAQGGLAAFSQGLWPNKVPLIIGSNREETKLFLSGDRSLDWRSPLYAAAAKFGSLEWKAVGVDSIADAIASHNDAPPVYVYRFDWGAPDASGRGPMPGDWGRRLGAFHSLDVSFFLGTESCLGPLYTGRLFTSANLPGREELSRGIMSYLSAFAASGQPGASGLPSWTRRPSDAASASKAGLPVGIVFDASSTKATFLPLSEVVTKEGVAAALDAGFSSDIAALIRKHFTVR